MRSFGTALLIAISCGGVGVYAQSQSGAAPAPATPANGSAASASKLVSAIRVTRVIRIVGTDTAKNSLYVLDSDPSTFGKVLNGATFVASDALIVTVPKLNPFKMQVTGSATAFDDPSAGTISKLFDAISGIPAIVRPESAKKPEAANKFVGESGPSCSAVGDAQDTINELAQLLAGDDTASAKSLKADLTTWSDAVDAKPGRQGIGDAVASIRKTAGTIQDSIKKFEDAIKKIRDGAHADLANEKDARNKAKNAEATAQQDVTAAEAELSKLKAAKKPTAQEQKQLDAKKAALKSAGDARKVKEDDLSCALDGRSLYQLAEFALPLAQLARLKDLGTTLKSLADTLDTTYGKPSSPWDGTDFVIVVNLTPSADKAQRVVIKQVTVEFTADDDVLTSTKTDAGSATFEVYQFRRFIPEIGVGATFGFVTRPKYGTGTNAAGQTIVARQKDDRLSIDPTVMVNFVPWGASGATPMVQVGASASKTSPAVFFGGGWRVFGTSKGFAIGGGLMLAWVKDLQTLSEGSVVKGTKDIEDDLGFDPQPRPRFYFTLQYKF